MQAHWADVSIRSLLLALTAAVVLTILRRRRTAALQHAVWASVVCGMLTLFAVGSALPRLRLPVVSARPIALIQAPLLAAGTAPLIMDEVGTPVPIPAKPHRSVDWSEVVLCAYAGIAFAFLVRFLTGLFLARRLIAESTPIDGFRESSLIAVPFTVGWFRPRILLPPEWRVSSQAGHGAGA